MDIEALERDLTALAAEAQDALASAADVEDAFQIKNRYLGRNGRFAELMRCMRDLPGEARPRAGQASNACKRAIEATFDGVLADLKAAELAARIEAERLDVTLPARAPHALSPHPLRATEQDLVDIFVAAGYEVATGPEVEQDFYNFEALNFPPDHPARDMQDTFVLEGGQGDLLMRTHTSPVQIRTMLAYEPPIRVISPGRVYRLDDDSTHSPVFHQVEGLLVDEGVTFADLKGTLRYFIDACFGPGTPVRFRPSYFPFTEPSAEVDIGCIFCEGDGCRVCSHTGWLEIMGCGMVDPNVLRHVGIDPDRYSGFAFGMGVERIAMLRHQVPDIRLMFGNDLRFLTQFS
jgi:phenylalanyl-tRNA synthetase alpha chain